MYQVEEVSIFVKSLKVYDVVTSKTIRDRYIEVYSFIFGISPSCAGCPNEIEVAIQKLKWIMMLQIKTGNTDLQKANEMTKYTMNPSVRIMSSTLGIMVTQFNCTDAIAEALIKENEKYRSLFTINVSYKAQEGRAVVNNEATVNVTEMIVEEKGTTDLEFVTEKGFDIVVQEKKSKKKGIKKR